MSNSIQAHFVIDDTEYGCEYDADHPQAFMASAWGLWTKARELDVLPEAIEPNGAQGLQLLAQMQLLDEAELKKRVAEMAGFLRASLRHFDDGQHFRYQSVLAGWEYTKKPLNIIRTQSDLDFHRDRTLPEIVSLLEELRCYHIPEINVAYPGRHYRQRFWSLLLDKLISEPR